MRGAPTIRGRTVVAVGWCEREFGCQGRTTVLVNVQRAHLHGRGPRDLVVTRGSGRNGTETVGLGQRRLVSERETEGFSGTGDPLDDGGCGLLLHCLQHEESLLLTLLSLELLQLSQ